MVKHTQTICRQKLTNCLRVFDHFVGLALKRLRSVMKTVSKLRWNSDQQGSWLAFWINKTSQFVGGIDVSKTSD